MILIRNKESGHYLVTKGRDTHDWTRSPLLATEWETVEDALKALIRHNLQDKADVIVYTSFLGDVVYNHK